MRGFLDTAFSVWLGIELAEMSRKAKSAPEVINKPDLISNHIDPNLPADEWLQAYCKETVRRGKEGLSNAYHN